MDERVGSALLLIGIGGITLVTIWELREYLRAEVSRDRFFDELAGNTGMIAGAASLLLPGVGRIVAFALTFLAFGVLLGRRWERRVRSAAQQALAADAEEI